MSPGCLRCAEPMVSERGICGRCLTSPPAFGHCLALFHYTDVVQWMIQQFKFHQGLLYGRWLAQCMVENLPLAERFCRPDVIVPVPLHASRMRQRGYNQAGELGKHLAKELGLHLDLTACERVLKTKEQTALSAQKRRRNLRNAFIVKQDFSGANVVVIDDVITTSATANAMAHALKKAGAEQVFVWAVARS